MHPRDPRYWPTLAVRMGILGGALLAAVVPMCLAMAISPWAGRSLQPFFTSIPIAFVSGALMALVGGLGCVRQPRWWRMWSRITSHLLLIGWVATIAVALLYPLGLIRPTPPGDLTPMAWTALVFLAALSLAAWAVVRFLRDPALRQ